MRNPSHHFASMLALGLLFLLSEDPRQASGQGRGEAPPQESVSIVRGHEIRAAAPTNAPANGLLGMVVNADFRRVGGRALPAGGVQRAEIGESRLEYREMRGTAELQANAGVLFPGGGASGSYSSTSSQRHGIYRARTEAFKESIGDRVYFEDLDSDARFVVSEVIYGHMYELVLSGSQGEVQRAIRANYGPVRGGAGDAEGYSQLEYRTRSVGFEAPSNMTVVRTERQIRENYQAVGQPRPILVVYRSIPANASVARASASRVLQVELVSVTFPRRNPRRGTGWDVGLGAAPEIMGTFSGAAMGHSRVDLTGCPNNNYTCTPSGKLLLSRRMTVTHQSPLLVDLWDRDAMSGGDRIDQISITGFDLPRNGEIPPNGVRVRHAVDVRGASVMLEFWVSER